MLKIKGILNVVLECDRCGFDVSNYGLELIADSLPQVEHVLQQSVDGTNWHYDTTMFVPKGHPGPKPWEYEILTFCPSCKKEIFKTVINKKVEEITCVLKDRSHKGAVVISTIKGENLVIPKDELVTYSKLALEDLVCFGKVKPEMLYRRSGMFDKNGVEILEGSIIDVDGYKSNIEENHFHCVVEWEGQLGSDIYRDFEPLSSYKEIEVVGHAEQFRDVHELGMCSGNLGWGLK
jgi:hypothetical protein